MGVSQSLKSSGIQKVPRKPLKELGLRALVDASDDGIIATDANGIVVYWNKGAEKVYGYKAEEALGRSISILIPPDHPDELPEIMTRFRRGEHIATFETTRIRKDGHPIDVSVTVSPVKGRGGEVVGVIAVARDFTKHKQAEEALRVSEERFRLALKSTPVVVFSHDRQLRYTWMSSPNFPVRPENYLGRTDTEVFPGKEGARLTAIKEEVLRTGVGSHTEVTVTLQGEVHDFDLVVQRLSDAKEKLLGLLCSAIDITSLKQTIGRLRQALNEIQVMRGLLPTCASCHRIKDERGDWQPMEGYIQAHSKAKFSHGVCPDCLKKLYPDYYP